MTGGHASIRRLVVLGHSGFIGTRLCREIRATRPEVDLAGVSLDTADLATAAATPRLVDEFRGADAVVILAGIKKQLGDSLEAFEQNMAIATNVSRALDAARVPRLVFFSSAEVYGEQTNDTAMTELTPVRPTSYYGAAKFASEILLPIAARGAT
ncbi:MAG: NAD-dependent epimerase/dehydratase family protein [Chloroflexi bacterium]|nr:NAD-dependent epimerase/dehydratase family protein [Chloroflexota bacterium]